MKEPIDTPWGRVILILGGLCGLGMFLFLLYQWLQSI